MLDLNKNKFEMGGMTTQKVSCVAFLALFCSREVPWCPMKQHRTC